MGLSSRHISGLLITIAVLLLAAGCRRESGTALRPLPPVAPGRVAEVQAAAFVGSAACGECHAAEYKTQSHSYHANTLRLTSRKDLGKLAPPTGPIPGTNLLLVEKKDGLGIVKRNRPNVVAALNYAFGSGKTGMTYVLLLSGEKMAEMRMSYFPKGKKTKWYITPGQEHFPITEPGRVREGGRARDCVLCHAVTLPSSTLFPTLVAEERFLGVGCESCHGPGSAHITAMRAGQFEDSRIDTLVGWPATRLNTLCGKCHVTEQMAQTTSMSGDETNRFQAYGLMKSQCFQQSKDTLSCITCHNPHTNASTNLKTYEAACLSCHASPASAHRPPPLRATKIKQCPVNPKENCVSCHMPKRRAIASSQTPIMMPDHFIRVHPRQTQS